MTEHYSRYTFRYMLLYKVAAFAQVYYILIKS